MKIRGTVSEFRGTPQITVDRIRLADDNDTYDLSALVPVAPIDVDTTMAEVERLISSITDADYRKICSTMMARHRPVVPAGPTQEDLDAEYIRICQSYDPTSDEWTVDRYNRRWIMCTVCGRIKQDAQMSYYGGKGGANRGVCADCSRNGRS